MNDIQIRRGVAWICKKIEEFKLDLKGLTIYTEIGSGNYAFTPAICLLAGADYVEAVTGDFLALNIVEVVEVLRYCGFNVDIHTLAGIYAGEKFNIHYKKREENVKKADIITNLGYVRPIDKQMISWMKPTAVISLMYDTKELRPQDVDIQACKKKEILALGLNEEAPPIDMMRYGGFLATKLMFDCGLEVHKDEVLVVGKGRLSFNIWSFFRNNKTRVSFMINRGSSLKFPTLDAIIIADNEMKELLIGEGGWIKPSVLAKENPNIQIIHICGRIDEESIRAAGLSLYPEIPRPAGYMSFTGNYLGPKLTLEMIIGGLKVGEIMARNRMIYPSLRYAYLASLNNPLVMDIQGGYFDGR
jgi:hypothetical protein